MKGYSEISFEEIENTEEYALLMIEKGYVFVKALIDESNHQILEITSYALLKHCIRNSASYVLVDWMVPIFTNDGNHTNFSFHYHSPDVISLFRFDQAIKSMEKHFEKQPYSWEDIPNNHQHYDFYVSTEPKNISDLYEQLEYSFTEELAKEKNLNTRGPPVNDQLH